MKEFVIKYWLQTLFAATLAGMGVVYRKLKCQQTDYEAIKNGVKALLRAQIISTYNKYENEGEMPIYARENMHGLYESYKSLGGNGAIDELMVMVAKLPNKKGG
jgi:hypothetical protein